MPITVVNKYKTDIPKNDERYVYIGRGSALGNPFTHLDNQGKAEYKVESREIAVESYRKYLEEKIKSKDKAVCNELNRIYKLAMNKEIYLVCYCAPKPCHGDVIKEIIEEKQSWNV